MNRDEVIKCLKNIRLAYPNAFKSLSKKDAEEMITVWLKMFTAESFEEVDGAVTSLIQAGAKFAPSVGDIKAELGKAKPQSTWELNRRPYPQSFIETVHKFLVEEEKAGRYKRSR